MFRLLRASANPLCDGFTRRELLQIGSIGLAGLSLPNLLQAQERDAPRKSARHCVLLFLNGGPSHLDMWDLKPNAPVEIRGEFKPISTTVPGIQYGEHLPRMAQQAHHFALIRSAHHSVNNAHAAAVYTALTGEDRGDANIAIGKSARDLPAIGSVFSHLRPPEHPVPAYVSLPYIAKEGAGPPQPGFYGGLIGKQHDPFFILQDPNAANFRVPDLTLADNVTAARMAAREGLLRDVNQRMGALDRQFATRAVGGFQKRAFSLLTSAETRRAFDLGQEKPETRDRYGRNIYGQSTLLARRLIEAGTRMVTLSWAPDANATWDTHGNNFKTLRETLLPQLDAAVSSLVGDLHHRRMLEETLVVVMGEFGRTPKINGGAGRDHWNYCYSLALAGGGVRGGAVYGASDDQGAFPREHPVTPQDIMATIYHLLGFAPETEFIDHLNRPFKLVPNGRVIGELIA